MSSIASIPRLAVRQLTRDEAVRFATDERWRALSIEDRGLFQLRQDCLCMPFGHFVEGMNALLGRPVFTHEFADPDALWAEYQGAVPSPAIGAVIENLERRLAG
ncbi:hypothetical protein [uncultured Sphingomonas sp.]|uniref:DUF7736 domain-containing protein n=1 Tax=uncultured Sphingomonas sp. TaxID=158754 RepID=UPI002616A1EB|nr:hypothetical protein [uncultured Sphingomonas sp.]